MIVKVKEDFQGYDPFFVVGLLLYGAQKIRYLLDRVETELDGELLVGRVDFGSVVATAIVVVVA